MTPRIVVPDAGAEVDFLRAAFAATGEIHPGRPAEVRIGDSLLMVSAAGDRQLFPAFLYVYVEDADVAYRNALDAGAESVEEPFDTPYGDRRAMVRDRFGNVFQIAHRPEPGRAGMRDRKPPRFPGDDREALTRLLQYQRESLVRKVADLTEDAARRQLVPTGTSLLWLVKHLTAAEVLWVLRRFAGLDIAVPDETLREDDAIGTAVGAYRRAWADVDLVVAAASLEEPCRGLEAAPPANLRWVLAHLLEETARHAGHADILRELIDGQTGR